MNENELPPKIKEESPQDAQKRLFAEQQEREAMAEIKKQEDVKRLTLIAWIAFVLLMIGLIIFAVVYLWGSF